MRFNGVDPREISSKIFPSREIVQAIPPRTNRTLETAGGPLYAGQSLQARQIKVSMNFAGRSHENANELVRLWNAVVCTDTPGELELTHMPGHAFTAILESAGEMSWQWGFGTIEYVFSALRPFMHSTAESVVSAYETCRIEPRGTVPIRPKITHTMANAAAELILSLDSVPIFRLRPATGTFSVGTTLVIDFEKRLIKMGGQPAMTLVDYTASNWHPDIKKACTLSLNDAGATEIRWRDEWM